MRAETTRVGGLWSTRSLKARSTLQTQVLGCVARRASADEGTAPALPDGAQVWEISRLRLLNQRPVIWEMSTIPKVLAADLGSYIEMRDPRGRYMPCWTRSTASQKCARAERLAFAPGPDPREGSCWS